MSTTCIFGGAFDPVHKVHVEAVAAALRETAADRLLLIPTYYAPHKKGAFFSFDERISLLKAAFTEASVGVPVEISDVEKHIEGKSYSAVTLEIVRKQLVDRGETEKPWFLLGGDSLEKFSTWYEPQKILDNARIVANRRDGKDLTSAKNSVLAQYRGEVRLLDYSSSGDVSSTIAKAKLLLRLPTEELTAEVRSVAETFDRTHKYYPVLDELSALLSQERYAHTMRTVLTALSINKECALGLDFERVFLAALLHDCGKHRSVYSAYIPADSLGTKVEHQFEGAESAARDFGVSDDEILSAIRYHTTAKPDMTDLEKLIFVADMLEPERDYAEVEELRSAVKADFSKGVALAICASYRWLLEKGKTIYPLTRDAYEFYKGEII